MQSNSNIKNKALGKRLMEHKINKLKGCIWTTHQPISCQIFPFLFEQGIIFHHMGSIVDKWWGMVSHSTTSQSCWNKLKLFREFKNGGVEGLDGLGIFITRLKDLDNLTNDFWQYGFNGCESWRQTSCVPTLSGIHPPNKYP